MQNISHNFWVIFFKRKKLENLKINDLIYFSNSYKVLEIY